ncbi:ATP-binding protein [Flavobacteriaceae bacterium LMO-SS05]
MAILVSYLGFSQNEQDSMRVSNSLELERLEGLLKNAREGEDIYNEIIILNELVFFKSRNFQDFTSSYIDAKNLEILIEENPDIKITNQLKSKLFDYLSWLLQLQEKTNESITYIKKAIKASEDDGNTRQAKNHLIRLAILENDLGNKTKSDSIFDHIENWALKQKDSEFLAAQYETKCWMSLRSGSYLEAIKFGNQCLKLSDNFTRTTYNNMSESYLGLNKPDSALIYAKKAFEAVLSIDHIEDRANAHQNLRKSYAALNDFEQAYYHFNEYNKIEEKHNSYKNALQIGNYNTQREREKIGIQEALAAEKLANQRLIIWIIIAALCVLILGLLYIFNRLKLIRKQNKIIEQEKLRVEQSERYKEQFLANMSHEIRTPLHAISGMINSLERNSHPESQNIFLDAMKTSSENLMVLLNDILDFSKIASGKLEIEHIPMNPIEVVENVVKTLQYRASEKGIELLAEIGNNFPKRIIGDPSRLNQILLNLVGNAIKFTNSGSVKIIASHTQEHIKFAIKDTGIGISKDKLDLIFDVFKQGEKSKSQTLGGTGLGLSISKQLVELQNGTLIVESVLGEGSTFYVHLPIKIAESSEDINPLWGEEQLKDVGILLKGIKILLAEDDEFNILVVKDDLTYYIPNVNISVVKNGAEAITKYKTQEFDVILMDKHMPVLNGCEASEKIRELEKNNHSVKPIPIIAMTASLLKSEIEDCIKAGMNGYLPKPYKPEKLINTIYNVVKNRVV